MTQDSLGTLRWFGHRYDGYAWRDMPEVPTPVGQECGLCPAVIGEGDDGLTVPDGSTGERVAMHAVCFMRTVGVPESLMPRRIEGGTGVG